MKKFKHKIQTIYVACLAFALAMTPFLAISAGTISFNNAADLNRFNLNGDASTKFTFNATAGVGGGGGIVSSSTNYNTSAAVYRTTSSVANGSSAFVSLDYRMAFQSTGPDVRLGFINAPTVTPTPVPTPA